MQSLMFTGFCSEGYYIRDIKYEKLQDKLSNHSKIIYKKIQNGGVIMFRSIIISVVLIFAIPIFMLASQESYLVVGGGVNLQAEELEGPLYFTDVGIKTDTGTGFLLNLAVGTGITNNLRIEGEISYRNNDIKDIRATYVNAEGVCIHKGEGSTAGLSFMANGWYDIYKKDKLSVFLGMGIGAAMVSLNDLSVFTSSCAPGSQHTKTVIIDDNEWQFAYQGGAGIGYEVKEGFIIDLQYRYFTALNTEFDDVANNKIKMGYKNHSGILAIRYIF